VIPPEGPDLIPSEVSKAGDYLVIHEDSFCRVGISSNVYVASLDGKHYLFDASGDPELMRYLKHLGITKGSVGAVFLTHGHYDHVRGLLSLSAPGTPVFLAGADRMLAEECIGKMGLQEMAEGGEILNRLGLQVLRTPGHTPGSVCFYSREKRLLISGDTVFSEGYFGRTDLAGGNGRQMVESLESLSKLEADALLPGHGVPLLENAHGSVAAALDNARYFFRA
jgi:glyoxylase-like metal-dependent hydrolase (beta-lactamase superfamily II)